MPKMLHAVLALLLCTVALVAAGPSASAAYPGRDGKVALVRANQIHTVAADGSGLRRLTSTGKNYRPRWSPDGARIAYTHETAAGARDVWVMNADGSGQQRVTRLGTVTAPASWSPDGRQLAFAGDGVLMKVRATAPFGSPTTLQGHYTGCYDCDDTDTTPRDISVDRYLAWSPDGRSIALYNHSDAYYDDALYVYDTVTREARQLRASGADCCGYVEWSDLFFGPGGALGHTERDRGEYGSGDAPSTIRYAGFTGRPGDTGGAPSPSGTRIALTNASSGTAEVFVTSATGSGRRLLTRGYQPDWQPLR